MSYKHEDARRGYEQAVETQPEDYAWSEWHIYPEYKVGEHERRSYIYAPMADPVSQLRGRTRYRPLSRLTAALFLDFARWPETEGMDRKPLGSARNEAAAREWAEINGVLGLDSTQPFTVFDEASGAIEHSLGVHAIHPRHRNEGNGGLEETVEAFATEAWVANIALRLFEAATNPEGPDMDTIVGYMPHQQDGFGEHLPSVRQLHGVSPRLARSWALQVVEEIVEDRMRGHVWPLPVRDHNGHPYGYAGHKQGWAFDSLLGAMWLQMMWLMRGQPRRCEWCGKLLDVDSEQDQELQIGGAGMRRKRRNDRRFCPTRSGVKDKCKADWNYHRGGGKSNKVARKQKRNSNKSRRS